MAIDGDNGRTSTVGGGNTGYNWSGYAEWLAKTKNSTKTCNLIVNYYANGYNGSAAENPPPSSVRSYTGQSVDVRLVVEVASGDTMSNPGYVFVGWATSNNTPTVTYNPGDTISNSWAADYRGNSVTNLYAVWTNQNVITYNPDDNSIEKSAIYQVKQSGQSATLKGATFTRTGYTQTGWATTAGGPKAYDLGGTYSSNNPLSLYPVWQANTYTITYVANEGTGTMADQTVTYDSTFTPRACSFTREGYSFSSWNESQDGKGIRWKVQEYTVDRAENITLYAIWKGNEYTVYYDDNYSRYSDEITGDIATFESEYAQPLKKAEVSLSPIQDLNGYSSPWIGTDYDQQPYNFRAVSSSSVSPLGNSEMGNIVGGTVAWNQLLQPYSTSPFVDKTITITPNANGTLTLNGTSNSSGAMTSYKSISAIKDHIYFSSISKSIEGLSVYTQIGGSVVGNAMIRKAASSGSAAVTLRTDTNVTYNNVTVGVVCFDLTAMFGSTIAGYLYGLESGTAGAGVAKLKSWGFCTKDYYAYDSGSLQSVNTSAHKTVGFNQWDEVWERGAIGMSTGQNIDSNDKIRSKNYVPIFPNTTYYFKMPNNWRMCYYDANKNLLNNGNTYDPNRTLTSPDGAYYLRFVVDGTTAYANNVCINLSKTSGTPKNGDYVAYAANTYALDSSLTLRGIPKLDANNNLYYDGDSYAPDGTVTRKYGIVDLGTLNWQSSTPGQFLYEDASFDGASDPNGASMKCSSVLMGGNAYDGGSDNVICARVGTYKRLWVKCSAYSTADSFTTAMSGVYLVYELATPTTETATAYAATQSIDPYGTEEYVDYAESQGTRDVAISVGHYTNYANICPITGRTGLNVWRTGINVWDEQWEVGQYNTTTGDKQYNANRIRCKNLIPVKGGKDYYLVIGSATSDVYIIRCYYDENGNFLNGSNSRGRLFSVPVNACFVAFSLDNSYGATYQNDISLNYPSTDTDYHAYQGNTYSIDWTTEAGTVYGGMLDVVTGVLTVTHGIQDLGGLDWTYQSGSTRFFSSGISASVKAPSSNGAVIDALCSQYKYMSLDSLGIASIGCAVSNIKNVYIKNTAYTDPNALKTALSGVQFVYELATPLTYQLTAQEVALLVGTNNVWSDGGPITIVYALDEVPQNMPPSTAIFGDIFYTRRNQLSRFGLTFKGWNTVPDGSGEAWLPSGVSMGTYKRTEDAVWNVSHNVTLYAQWDPNVYPFGTVFFNGRNAQDLGIIVEELPSYYYAERAFNHKQVNGKNGDVILDTGRYENVKKVYKVACYDPSRNFYESAVALSTFLHSAGSDYIRLEDSYEPSSYRMAIYEETNEIENLLGKAGRCEITFNCMPQRFLLSGDEEIAIPSSGYSIYNPTAFDAKPMIRIQGTGTVTINGRSVQVTENDNDMLVDCENQNAKDLSGADMNYFIYCDEFPILKPGFNTISYTETIDAVKITPRWWIL